MKNEHIYRISKLQAAKEQIDEAIWMFFNKRSAVAIHSIVGAAHQVLHDVSNRSISMVKSQKQTDLRGEGKDWIKKLNKEYNFFKHGIDDPSELLTFDPLLHAFYLVDCVYMYRNITGEKHFSHSLYDTWFSLSHPGCIGNENVREFAKLIATHEWDPNDLNFFAELLDEYS